MEAFLLSLSPRFTGGFNGLRCCSPRVRSALSLASHRSYRGNWSSGSANALKWQSVPVWAGAGTCSSGGNNPCMDFPDPTLLRSTDWKPVSLRCITCATGMTFPLRTVSCRVGLVLPVRASLALRRARDFVNCHARMISINTMKNASSDTTMMMGRSSLSFIVPVVVRSQAL